MHRNVLFLLIVCLVSACKECPDRVIPFTQQEFNGRDETIAFGQSVRRAVYRAKVPLTWKRIDPNPNETLSDTTKPIVSFALDEQVLLTVHNFPTESIEERISPMAQVERWGSQLSNATYVVEKTGWGGFSGYSFEGKNDTISIFAWSLQLDMEHYQNLHFSASTVEEEEHYKQMASDFTIKAIGPTALIEKHRAEISLFASSFELIQEIPSR